MTTPCPPPTLPLMATATAAQTPPELTAAERVELTAAELFTLYCVRLMRCRPGDYPDGPVPDLTCVQHSK